MGRGSQNSKAAIDLISNLFVAARTARRPFKWGRLPLLLSRTQFETTDPRGSLSTGRLPAHCLSARSGHPPSRDDHRIDTGLVPERSGGRACVNNQSAPTAAYDVPSGCEMAKWFSALIR